MSHPFARKPIAELVITGDARSLERVLGAVDLVILAIGAVIGAGIFGVIATAAAGQAGSDCAVIRYVGLTIYWLYGYRNSRLRAV
jgi:APA family basic amino acid/polyamine antiporter